MRGRVQAKLVSFTIMSLAYTKTDIGRFDKKPLIFTGLGNLCPSLLTLFIIFMEAYLGHRSFHL